MPVPPAGRFRKYRVAPSAGATASEWPKDDWAIPGIGRLGASLPAVDDARRIGELERKIRQLTMENDFLKALQHFRVIIRRPSSTAGTPV